MSTEPRKSPALSRVLDGKLCSGCGACAAIAQDRVGMKVSDDGYLRPEQRHELTPEQEDRVRRSCPGLGYRQDPGARPDHPLWGPFLGMYQGYARDEALRHRASSGGALSAIALHLLDTDAVDHVVQVTADPQLPIGNLTVVNSDTAAVFEASGSRYAPSAPLAGLEAYLETDARHAFVGKPCDVAALRAMSRFDERIDRRFPYMLSFFCAGVPSLDGAREILSVLGIEESELSGFRYRGNGWPGFACATTGDGTSREMSYADSWGGILSRHVQFRCRICPDGTGGFADLVCADAWEADENGYPAFEERDGLSLIMGRTEKGEALIRDAVEAGRIAAEPFDPAALAAIQPGQTQKRRYALARLAALACLGRPAPKYSGFHLLRNALRAGPWRNLRNFLGTLRRAARGRL